MPVQPCAPTLQASHSYDLIGNLTAKGSSHTGYDYTNRSAICTENPGYSQPHAVKQLTVDGQNRAYCYDARGNTTRILGAGVDQTIDWTSFDKPSLISGPSHSSAFSYDHERRRWKQERISPAGTETRYYVEGLYERVVVSPTLTEHVHYIRAAGETVAIVKRWNTDQPLFTRWIHTDHLGSIAGTTPAQAELQQDPGSIELLSYDAWGERRDPFSWATGSGQPSQWTDRGFTQHEHLEELGLIHMNGRVYSPDVGRFISADPYVQFPDSSQGLNRYSYVLNRPLAFADPTGYRADALTSPWGVGIYWFALATIANVYIEGKLENDRPVETALADNDPFFAQWQTDGWDDSESAWVVVPDFTEPGARFLTPTSVRIQEDYIRRTRSRTDEFIGGSGVALLATAGTGVVNWNDVIAGGRSDLWSKILKGVRVGGWALAVATSLSGDTPQYQTFYHGTDIESGLALLAGAPLSVDIATAKHIDGPISFHLADNYLAAEYFAARREGGVLTYRIRNYAVRKLIGSGANIQRIPAGGVSLPGNELVIPPGSFGLFDALRARGHIIVTPTPVPE